MAAPRTLSVEVGQRFGKVTVLEETRMPLSTVALRRGTKLGQRAARILCDCGNEKLVLLSNLCRGDQQSCGKCVYLRIGDVCGYGIVLEPDIEGPPKKDGTRNIRHVRLQCTYNGCVNVYVAKLYSVLPDADGYVKTSSCGCYKKEMCRVRWTGHTYGVTHGLSTAANYMCARKIAASNESCAQWKGDIPTIIEYLNQGLLCDPPFAGVDIPFSAPPEGYDLSRIELDQPYEPGNLIWKCTYEYPILTRGVKPKILSKLDHWEVKIPEISHWVGVVECVRVSDGAKMSQAAIMRCVCGNERTVIKAQVEHGRVVSCGCKDRRGDYKKTMTDDQVRDIRARYYSNGKGGFSNGRALATEYGVPLRTINSIARCITYKDII
jgi:hypothetical protein